MLHTYRESNITFLRSALLDRVPGVRHAFSTRRAETPNLTFGGDDRVARDDRDRFMAAVGMEAWPEARLKQIHSNIVHWVEDNELLNEAPEGDAAATPLPGVAVGVMTADCVPILIAGADGSAVAAAHAGWRGTADGVVRRTVDRLVEARGIEPSGMVAAIGPHIGVCCMEVGEEVYDWFAQPEVFERRAEWEKPHLDLGEANRLQLVGAGIPEDCIQVSTLCTRCRPDLFHSYRRDGVDAGRMLAVIGREP